jgi:hypothetical protein
LKNENGSKFTIAPNAGYEFQISCAFFSAD